MHFQKKRENHSLGEFTKIRELTLVIICDTCDSRKNDNLGLKMKILEFSLILHCLNCMVPRDGLNRTLSSNKTFGQNSCPKVWLKIFRPEFGPKVQVLCWSESCRPIRPDA